MRMLAAYLFGSLFAICLALYVAQAVRAACDAETQKLRTELHLGAEN